MPARCWWRSHSAPLLTGAQGFIVGYFRANPIIVSMAALALILGFVTLITGGRGIYPDGSEGDVLKGNIGAVPKSLAAFLLTVLVGQFILSFTRFGRNIYMVGSNLRAAEAAGIATWRTVTGAYVVAGLCTAFSAVLMAARYASGDMEHGLGYDYQAISAVLVGGTAIAGGEGSALRTLAGAFIIAVVEGLLLLNGFSTQMAIPHHRHHRARRHHAADPGRGALSPCCDWLKAPSVRPFVLLAAIVAVLALVDLGPGPVPEPRHRVQRAAAVRHHRAGRAWRSACP